MPLVKSKSKDAFAKNVKAEMKTGKPRDQALAIAYAVQRKNRANGGVVTGPLVSSVAGRTDHLPLSVPSGSYVIPADIVSGLGQGNTLSGMKVIESMFSSGPYGMKAPSMGGPFGRNKSKKRRFADGGATGPVDIMAAGGEYVLTPEEVANIGNGDMDLGHDILDKWVIDARKKNVKTQSKLPGPERD